MVFTYRMTGEPDWNTNWDEFKSGFGEHPGDFYMGNELLHQITTSGDYEFYYTTETLTGPITNYDGWYEKFYIENEVNKYRLHLLGDSDGTVDELVRHNNRQFSTKDSDNDKAGLHCAKDKRLGGFWWDNCGKFNPHGVFHGTSSYVTCMGIKQQSNSCSKYFQMMIRRR